jgi:hypothetical protein
MSIAEIPWLGSKFVGFLLVAWLDGRLLRLATYTGARVLGLDIAETSISARIAQGPTLVEVRIDRARGGLLRAPVNGSLTRRISETVDAVLHLRWTENGRLVFEGEAPKAGLEVAGDASRLVPCRRQGGQEGTLPRV